MKIDDIKHKNTLQGKVFLIESENIYVLFKFRNWPQTHSNIHVIDIIYAYIVPKRYYIFQRYEISDDVALRMMQEDFKFYGGIIAPKGMDIVDIMLPYEFKTK